MAVWKAQGFWTLIGLAVFYAVTQGGSFGFSKIIDACAAAIKKYTGTPEKKE